MSRHSDTILDRIERDYDPDCRPWPGTAQSIDAGHVRAMCGSLAADLVRICPQSRELNHALNRIDEAESWAAKAIERHGVSSPEVGS